MSVLQLSLLILALAAIALVAFISHQRSQPPKERPRKTPRVDGAAEGEEQLDLLKEEGAAPRFDEFGVSEPRPSATQPARRATDAPSAAAMRPAEPPPSPRPSAPAASRKGAAGASRGSATQDDRIISLFVVQRDKQPIAGTRIHRTLHHLGLEHGERQTYERRVGDETWFHVANMLKPGHLDPDEADALATPGLSLFQVPSSLHDPVAALDDLLATADRLADAFDGVVLNGEREPLTDSAASSLRSEIHDWWQQSQRA